MFEIDYDPDKDTILISGVSAAKLLKGAAGTTLSVILDFKPSGDDTLIAPSNNRPGAKIAEIVKIFEKSRTANKLSTTAKAVLTEHISYLRAFRTSSLKGREILKNKPTSITLPRSFKRELKPFQIPSVTHLLEVTNAANFSVPGSGKTTMVLAAYSVLKERAEVTKLLVICPRSAFEPWIEEYRGCFDKDPVTLRIAGTPQERVKLLNMANSYELFLCTYQMLVNEIDAISRILRNNKCLLVLDESHHIKRGEGGVWYDAVMQISPLAKRRFILTGTPAPNELDDIIPQFEAIWPELNPARKAMDLYGNDDKIEDFREALSPYYTRVKKGDLGLPPQNVIRLPVKLGKVQQRIYDVLCYRVLPQTLLKAEERSIVRDLRKAVVVRLLQAATNPTLLSEYSSEFLIPPLSSAGVDLDQLIKNYSSYETPEKLVVAANLAKKLSDEGRKSILWTSFVHNADLLHKLVTDSGIDAVKVTGSTAKDETVENNRDELLHKFKTDRSTMVLVATIPAIAESVSLHRECHDAIYVDRTFNCGLFMQSLDRIHRVGLPSGLDTRYHLLLGIETLDEVVDSRLQFKMETMYRILNDDIGILDLDVPDDLSEGDWDDDDISAILEHLRQHNSKKV